MVPRALGALARPMVYHPPPLCAAFRIQIVPASRFTGGRKRGALAWAARPPLTLGGSTILARFCTFETPGLPAILSFVFPRRRCLRRCCIREEGLHEAPTPQVTQVAQVAQSPSSESLRRQGPSNGVPNMVPNGPSTPVLPSLLFSNSPQTCCTLSQRARVLCFVISVRSDHRACTGCSALRRTAPGPPHGLRSAP